MVIRHLTAGVVSSALLLVPASAAVAQDNPYLSPDGSWASLSGTVTSTTPKSFQLDYGSGLITVEMDDWDWYADNAGILAGDQVTVYGEVDDDLYESATIEAGSVYVEDLGTYFYASPADEETVPVDLTPEPVIVVGDLTLTGTVTNVSNGEFTIDSGAQQVTVDATAMPYNPLDDEGYQQVEKGDRVSVTGNLETDTFESRELIAESIVTLNDQNSQTSGRSKSSS